MKMSAGNARRLLLLGEEFGHLVFVDHHFLVGVLSGYRIFDAFDHLDEILTGSRIGCPLGDPGVLGYLSHGKWGLMGE